MNLLYGVKDEAYKAVRGYEDINEIKKLFTSEHIELTAVKNQSAAFQVILFGDDEFSLSVTDTTCFDMRGIMDNIRLKAVLGDTGGSIMCAMNIVGFVEDDDRLYKAEILLKDESIYVEKGKVQPVWVEFEIPEYAHPGIYSGRIEIYSHHGFENERKIDELNFSIEVKDVLLPNPDKYSFYLDLWQHNSNIARKHEVALWGDEHFNVIEKYIESLAKLGQKAVTIIASEIPWSGQSCYRDSAYPSNMFEYNMIKVEKDINGKLILDFTPADRYIDMCFKYGINHEIEVFGLINIWMREEEGFGRVIKNMSDALRVRYLDTSDNCFKYIDNVDDITEYIKQIETYFKQKGVIDKVRIVADEPADVDAYNERLNFLRSVTPSFKYKTAINHVEFIKDNNTNVDDFVPVFTAVCEEHEKLKEIKEEIQGRVYWYVCCSPDIPNTYIKSHLLESYAIGWLTEYMKLDGFLRWNYTVWPEKPRERISFRSPFWKAGDTNFVYPSNNGSPLLTLRYKALQKGIQIFELINLLKEKNPHADEIIRNVFGLIFKFDDLKEFHPDSRKRIDELISLNYRDHVKALNMIINGIMMQDSIPA